MATILKPTKDYYIDNCPVLHVNEKTEGEHPVGFDEYPQMFLYEVMDNTRVEAEVPSDNNPVSLNLTGNINL